MTERTLTPEERKIVAPLLSRREALLRELDAVQAGLQSTIYALAGEASDDIQLDTNTWTIRRQPGPEAVAKEMADKLNGRRAAVTEGATDDR